MLRALHRRPIISSGWGHHDAGRDAASDAETARLKELVAQLNVAMETRTTIGMAIGMLMPQNSLTPEQAFDTLRRACSAPTANSTPSPPNWSPTTSNGSANSRLIPAPTPERRCPL